MCLLVFDERTKRRADLLAKGDRERGARYDICSVFEKESSGRGLPSEENAGERDRPDLGTVRHKRVYQIQPLSRNSICRRLVLCFLAAFVPREQFDEAVESQVDGNVKRSLTDARRRPNRLA